jgi:hypothetical protein
MSSWSRSFLGALCAVVFFSVPASAQVCGDADGNGQVSVTDGVQALRAAATLSTTCTAARCDVDGNGSISVTDGVNILRKAAALPITENCPGNTNQQIEGLLQNTLPIFGEMTKIGTISGARAAAEQVCDNGGLLVVDEETGDIEFFDCTLGTFNYDGFFAFGPNTFDFDITFTDVTSGASESLFGSLSERQVGEDFVVSGFFGLESSFGTFDVEFDELVTDPNGNFVGGSLAFAVDNGELSEVDEIRLTFSRSPNALVDVFLSDGSELQFNFDTISGELTPVSN